MATVNQFMNNKKQELREPELNRAKTDKELDEIHLGSMHIPISACYYHYLEIIIDTHTLVYDRRCTKTQFSSRPNSPKCSDLVPLFFVGYPKGRHGFLTAKKELLGNIIFSYVSSKSSMKGNDPRRKKKLEKQPNRLWTAEGEGLWHSEKQVVHCLAGLTMEPRLLRNHHTGRKPALNFKLTSSHL